MIVKENLLPLEYLKKTEYTGSHQGMRYRLEKKEGEDTKKLLVTVWPEPLNFIKTPDELKKQETFDFSDDGIEDAIAWMNDRLFEFLEEKQSVG